MAESMGTRTVISSIDAIIKAASYKEESLGLDTEYYRYDEKLIEEIREDAEFLSEKMDFTLLFSHFL